MWLSALVVRILISVADRVTRGRPACFVGYLFALGEEGGSVVLWVVVEGGQCDVLGTSRLFAEYSWGKEPASDPFSA